MSAALNVPVVPFRLHNSYQTPNGTSMGIGFTNDARYFYGSSGICKISQTATPVPLEQYSPSFTTTVFPNFSLRCPLTRCNLIVDGGFVYGVQPYTGRGFLWRLSDGKLISTTAPAQSSFVLGQTFDAKFCWMRKNSNGNIVRSIYYDNTEAQVLLPNTVPTRIRVRDYSMSNDSFFEAVAVDNYPSRLQFGASVSRLKIYYQSFGSVDYATVTKVISGVESLNAEYKCRKLRAGAFNYPENLPDYFYYDPNELTTSQERYRAPWISELVQGQPQAQSTPGSFQSITLENFDVNFLVARNASNIQFCLTRGVNVNFLIPRSFVQDGILHTNAQGNICQGFYTNGDGFGIVFRASNTGTPFLYFAGFSTKTQCEVKNYNFTPRK